MQYIQSGHIFGSGKINYHGISRVFQAIFKMLPKQVKRKIFLGIVDSNYVTYLYFEYFWVFLPKFTLQEFSKFWRP